MDIEDKSLQRLLKDIEVNRIWEQSEPDFSRSQMVRLSNEFIQESLETNDFRYLNTALKLNDWLRDQGALPSELETLEQDGLDELKTYVGLK